MSQSCSTGYCIIEREKRRLDFIKSSSSSSASVLILYICLNHRMELLRWCWRWTQTSPDLRPGLEQLTTIPWPEQSGWCWHRCQEYPQCRSRSGERGKVWWWRRWRGHETWSVSRSPRPPLASSQAGSSPSPGNRWSQGRSQHDQALS